MADIVRMMVNEVIGSFRCVKKRRWRRFRRALRIADKVMKSLRKMVECGSELQRVILVNVDEVWDWKLGIEQHLAVKGWKQRLLGE
jgi:hypothetical protein